MTNHPITERNRRLYDLRKELDACRARDAWIKAEIRVTNEQYERKQRIMNAGNLFQEMFGESQTLWDHLDRQG